MVVAEDPLVHVAVEVSLGHVDLRAFDGALQDRPETLQGVRVDISDHVFTLVVDRLVGKVLVKPHVGGGLV